MFCFNYANALPICTDTYSCSAAFFFLYFFFYFFLLPVAPVCRAGQRTTYSSGRHETVKVACEIDANPADATYIWKFNATQGETADIPASLVAVDRGRSVAHYTPMVENVSTRGQPKHFTVFSHSGHINQSMGSSNGRYIIFQTNCGFEFSIKAEKVCRQRRIACIN